MSIKFDLLSVMLYVSIPKHWKYNLYRCRAEVCERRFEPSDQDESLIAILFPLILKNKYFLHFSFVKATGYDYS